MYDIYEYYTNIIHIFETNFSLFKTSIAWYKYNTNAVNDEWMILAINIVIVLYDFMKIN